MSDRHTVGRVENFTQPFLITTGVMLFMALWVVGSLWGTAAVVLTTMTFELLIRIIGARPRPD